jgi:hypothetical protein
VLLAHLPRTGARAGSCFGLAILVAACADPQGDYDSFLARAPAPDAQPAAVGDAQPAEACPMILMGQASGVFYGGCLTTAAAGDVTQATYVRLDTMVVPSSDYKTGQLTVKITSLKLHATNVSQTVGDVTAPPSAMIAPDCTYVIEAGTTVIPAAATSLNTELVLSNTRYRGKLLTQDESCNDLDATLTTPVTLDLTMGGNACVFRRAPTDGAVTDFLKKASDFVCPGAPPAM